MRRWIQRVVVLGILLAGATARASDTLPPERVFAQAAQAYDEERFADAQILYEQLKAQGYVTPEIYFNLGNTLIRQGQLGLGILNYRRAHVLRPRDPDIAANTRFALDLAGALAPAPSPADRVFSYLTMGEWTALALSCYWSAMLMACLYLVMRQRPRWCLRLSGFAVVGLLAGSAGMVAGHGWRERPEAVVLGRDVQSLFAPLENATAHFKLPEGSLVRLEEHSGEWVKVQAGDKQGWIHQSACRAVWPLR